MTAEKVVSQSSALLSISHSSQFLAPKSNKQKKTWSTLAYPWSKMQKKHTMTRRNKFRAINVLCLFIFFIISSSEVFISTKTWKREGERQSKFKPLFSRLRMSQIG